jgi:hypothetical protein
MASTDYQFVTHWRVRATAEQVYDLLDDGLDLPRWWPSVYLSATLVEPGDANGIGKVIALHTKGWLPYTLRWRMRAIEKRRPHGFALEAEGDFVGRGEWSFAADGSDCAITFDWRIRADKPLLKYLSFVMRPLFGWNHRWAMAKGEESLKIELANRQGALSGSGTRAIPPGPTFWRRRT